MKKPNVFILGFPKCGTTTLAYWLSQHPAVYMAPAKEPNHFYSLGTLPMPRDCYDGLFEGADEHHKVVGEASACYMYSGEALDKIMAYSPSAKFIVCIRNPVDMAISLHNQRIIDGLESVPSFEDAWQLNDSRMAGSRRGIPASAYPLDPVAVAYREAASLGTHLKLAFQRLPVERVATVVLDDLRISPKREYSKLLAFLGLDDNGMIDFRILNQARRVSAPRLNLLLQGLGLAKKRLGVWRDFGTLSWLHRAIKQRGTYPIPEKRVYLDLHNALEPEIVMLEQLLNRQFPEWRNLEGNGVAEV